MLNIFQQGQFGRRRVGAADGGGSDPEFANVAALLHFEGTNGSTTFTDVKGHTFTPTNSPTISTAQFKFGSASGSFAGGNRYIEATSADFVISGQFTVEMFVRLDSLGAFRSLFTLRDNATVWSYAIVNSTGTVTFFRSSSATSVATLSINTWYHLAFTRDASNVNRIFIDGVPDGSFSNSNNMSNATGRVRIGYDVSVTDQPLVGYADEFRLTRNVARYTAGFTPPAAQFPDS